MKTISIQVDPAHVKKWATRVSQGNDVMTQVFSKCKTDDDFVKVFQDFTQNNISQQLFQIITEEVVQAAKDEVQNTLPTPFDDTITKAEKEIQDKIAKQAPGV